MPSIQVRPAQKSDIDACARLLSARHRRDSARLPHLNAELAEAAACRVLVEPLFSNPRAAGAIAVQDRAVVGFLFGERMLLPPSDFASQYIPPHSISIGIEGHAAVGAPALDVYRALYAELASNWVEDGFFTHRVAIPASDPEGQEAWVTLGFGRYLTAATRPVADPVNVANPRPLTIERASPEDIEEVLLLGDDLNAWHWQSPIFWPVLRATERAAREFNHGALRSASTPYFVAYDAGKPVGMQTFLRPGFTPPIVNREKDVYLFEGVVASAARSGGIGATLLGHSMEWARAEGFESSTLHFAPANPSGAPFWLGHGFIPVEHTMERTIDSRVAWARPHMHVGG